MLHSLFSENCIQFSGDDDSKETPVPMPNTEVKLIMPKILAGYPAGKIGCCQFYIFSNSSVGRAPGC